MKIEDLIQHRLMKDTDNLYIWLPAKMPKALNHLDKTLIADVHPDEATAKEFILYFLSFLSKTLFDGNPKEVSLHSGMLTELLAPVDYIKTINACLIGTPEKGPFIERDDNFVPGYHSKTFKFAPPYADCRAIKYRIKTESVKKAFVRNLSNTIDANKDNVIIQNLLQVYPKLEIPTKAFLLKEGKLKAADPEFRTKTGKNLVFRNRNPRSRFTKKYPPDTVSFVEDNIRKFESLTDPCFLPPMPQGISAGDRITDSFTLMPSWIRAYIKINGQTLVDVDFKALHPNIVMALYGGKQKFLTHQKVAERLGMDGEDDLPKFKKEHLAFFNKRSKDMKKSELLWEYYSNHEPELLEKVVQEKNIFRHTYTSKLMFHKEVAIMTDCIIKLNALGIHVLYVYDALLCEPQHKDTVEEVMNTTVLEHGVFTATYDKNEKGESVNLVSPFFLMGAS